MAEVETKDNKENKTYNISANNFTIEESKIY